MKLMIFTFFCIKVEDSEENQSFTSKVRDTPVYDLKFRLDISLISVWGFGNTYITTSTGFVL